MKKNVKYDTPNDLIGINKEVIEDKRENASTWSYFLFIVLFGFISIGFVFLSGILMLFTIIGCMMGAQLIKLASWILEGCNGDYDFKIENSKVENIVWLCLPLSWLLICINYLFFGLFWILYLRRISDYWLKAARAVTCPFGVVLDVK